MLRSLAPYLAYAYVSFVGLTSRLKIFGEAHPKGLRKSNQRFIFAFWHNRQVYFTYTHRDQNFAVLVSRSKDGEIIARTMELSRIHAPRGSSSRGASGALRQMLACLKDGYDLGITPDGPKGPAREVKSGVMFLAQKRKIPIVPIANAVSNKIVLKSWDCFQFPLPFSRTVVYYGAPIYVGPDDDVEAKAAQLKEALDRITDESDRIVTREGWRGS